jgi:hypothetical protein
MSESDSSVNDPVTKFAKELAGKLPVEAAYKGNLVSRSRTNGADCFNFSEPTRIA